MREQQPVTLGGSPEVGLIGCGSWGRHILRDLVDLGCRVTVVARSEATRAAAERAAAVVNDIGKLPRLDGIVVATPTTTHAEVVREALEREVPVFVEKPLTCDPLSARQLAEAGAGRLFVMDKWRYHPGVRELARIARSGELGPTVGLSTERIGWGNPHGDVDSVWILAPHDLAIGLEVLGRIGEPRAAAADRSGDYAHGMTALLGGRPWHRFEVSTRSPVRRRRAALFCRDGIAALADGYAEHIEIYRQGDPADPAPASCEKRPISTEMPLLRELHTFVEHLAGGPPPSSTAAEGAAAVEVLARLRTLAGLD